MTEKDRLGVGIELVLADADTDLTDDEVIKVRDDLLALFYGEMGDRIKREVAASKSSLRRGPHYTSPGDNTEWS